MSAKPEPPPLTPAMRARARAQPNTWFYAVDPAFDPDGEVPPWAIMGAWQVDDGGEIGGDFVDNPDYRPSPQALGLPEPTNELERVLQLAATGHAPDVELLGALLDTELLLFARDEADREIFVTIDSGRPVVQVFSSPARTPKSWTHWQRVVGRDLAPVLAGRDLRINPGSPVAVTIDGDTIRQALTEPDGP
ncbi:MAG TPA: type VII secretion system-associated protein [Mycobacteriales bacterium]|nr:type VII secretion system-associated protein [Mycobacteriales bacterium]